MALKTSRRGTVPPFIAMDVLAAAQARERAGSEVLHLEVGQPSSPAPAAVRATAAAALDREVLGYTVALGIPPLRRRIARHYLDRYGVTVDPDQVIIATGSSAAFLLSFAAAFEVGDRVALAAPGYPAYRSILKALGCVPVEIPTGPDTHFQPTPALIEALTAPVDGLIVASPANPTGAMLSADDVSILCGYCTDRGIRLISDEIYHGISYGHEAATAAGDPHAVVVNSFSKYYCMTGWRLGWLVVPPELARAVECLAQSLFISAPTLSQIAAVAAVDCTAELDGHVARYAENRRILLEGLTRLGIDRLAPADGAFYIYADIGHLTDDSSAFCRRLLDETGIAITPGRDFDPARGHHTVRLSFAGVTADMEEAVARLGRWLG